jgi:hypothetical protein
MQATLKSMGVVFPWKMSNVSLPIAGWDACERLPKAHGAT